MLQEQTFSIELLECFNVINFVPQLAAGVMTLSLKLQIHLFVSHAKH
jgi:hypothetical protein